MNNLRKLSKRMPDEECKHPTTPAVKYPHIVVRIMGAVYQRENIDIGLGEPMVQIAFRKSFLRHPNPFNYDGSISEQARQILITAVIAAVNRTRFRMCLIWGPNNCTFCEKDGSKESSDTPSGGLGSAGETPLPGNRDVVYNQIKRTGNTEYIPSVPARIG